VTDEHEYRGPTRIDVYHHFEGPLELKFINAAGEAVSFHLVAQPPTTEIKEN
jgi:hypothetical protein